MLDWNKLLIILATGLLLSTHVAEASGKPLNLSCRARQSDHADDRVKTADTIVIDVANKKIDLLSSAIGDGWTFENRGYNKQLDWFDEIAINQFEDGAILAGGVRAKATFGFNYNPLSGQIVYTFTDYGSPGYIIFDCSPRLR